MMRQKSTRKPWLRQGVQVLFYTVWPCLLLLGFFTFPSGLSSGSGSGSGAPIRIVHSSVTETSVVRTPAGDVTTTVKSTQNSLLTELADTDPADWSMAQAARGGAGAVGAADAPPADADDGKPKTTKERLESTVKLHAVYNGNGALGKFYYRFQHVRLTKKSLTVYLKPGEKPPREHWVDVVSGNASTPDLPTMLVIKGDIHKTKWYYVPIKYKRADESPAYCKGWVTKPTYLMQVRYSYNIWHTWNEGLMGAFQTLRELGMLPLAQVDADGNMREVTEGMGGSACPLVYDPATKAARPDAGCLPRADTLAETTCDTKNQPWCRQGIVSVNRFNGPVILPYSPESVMNVWSHVYNAMSEDIRDFNEVNGFCFRDLIVGKTSTLNFYQAQDTATVDAHMAQRVEAMSVFKQFVGTAQAEHVSREESKNPAASRYKGYADARMERMRVGIGPEDLPDVDDLFPEELPSSLKNEMPDLKKLWQERRAHLEEAERTAELAAKLKAQAAGSGGGSGGSSGSTGRRRALLARPEAEEGEEEEGEEGRGEVAREAALRAMPPVVVKAAAFKLESPRPVVTYMCRNSFSRGVLNEPDILRYVLERYNVTLRITTFEEPVQEVMATFAHTDVLFGMHGAGWTNGLFIKQGASTMQMYPYGWRLASGETIRGFNYREIVLASEVKYREWVNPRPDYAFFRRIDFNPRIKTPYRLHPDPQGELPKDGWPGNPWIYQNTYVDMESFGPKIDEMMAAAGIEKMPGAPLTSGGGSSSGGGSGKAAAAGTSKAAATA